MPILPLLPILSIYEKPDLWRHAQDSYSLALITVGSYITERKGPFSWTQRVKYQKIKQKSRIKRIRFGD